MFGATSIIKNSDKQKWIYIGYGIAFDGNSTWSFANDYATNLLVFVVGNRSRSSHADKHNSTFLVLDERDTLGINRTFTAAEKSLVLNLLTQKQNFEYTLKW